MSEEKKGIPYIDAAPIAAIQSADDGTAFIVFYKTKEDVGRSDKAVGVLRFDDFQTLSTFIELQHQLVGTIRQSISQAIANKYAKNSIGH